MNIISEKWKKLTDYFKNDGKITMEVVMKKYFFTILGIIIFFSCSIQEVEKNKKVKSNKTITTKTLRTSYKEVGDIKDLSYKNVKRISILISIPQGRTKEEVKATLERAAKEIGEREKPNALAVKGFAEDDKFRHGTYTAGEAIYAPNGKWEDAALSNPISISVKLGTLYFQNEKKLLVPQKNDTVTLVSKSGKPIKISNKRNSWVDEDIIAKFPAGEKAVVIEIYEEALSPDYKFVRYLIKVDNVKGWVDAGDIKL